MILLQIKLNYYQIAMMGAGLGALIGLLPLILGFVKKERGYGVFGFFGSIVGGAVLGVLLSIPIVAIFTWLIVRDNKQPAEVAAVNESPLDVRSDSFDNR